MNQRKHLMLSTCHYLIKSSRSQEIKLAPFLLHLRFVPEPLHLKVPQKEKLLPQIGSWRRKRKEGCLVSWRKNRLVHSFPPPFVNFKRLYILYIDYILIGYILTTGFVLLKKKKQLKRDMYILWIYIFQWKKKILNMCICCH